MNTKTLEITNTNRLAYGVLIAVGLFALYFAALGGPPLLDPDEPIYGQVAKEMAGGGGWLTPHYAGHVWFDKPPLFYWFSGICVRLLGPTELACRLPSAILAVGLVLLVYALASHDFGRRAGIISAVVIATCLQQIVLARAAVTDMTLVFCLTAALYAYRRWLDADRLPRFGWMALCGAATGLGMLAKGPVAPVLLGTTFIIHLVWTRHFRRLASADSALGIITMLVVGFPWFVAMYVIHKDAFVQGFLVANNLSRFLKPENASQTGHWYSCLVNFPVLLILFLPWSVFLPQAVARSWRVNDGAKLASVWFGVVFVFFSLSKTILPTYIFPLYPAAAIFVGIFWDAAASKDLGVLRGLSRGAGTAVGTSVLLLAGLVMWSHRKYPEAELSAVAFGSIFLVFTLAMLLWIKLKPGRAEMAVGIGGAGMCAAALWLVIGMTPFIGPRQSTRELMRSIPRSPEVTLATLGLNKTGWLSSVPGLLSKPSILFYANRRPVDAGDAANARAMLSGDKPLFVICRRDAAGLIMITSCVEWASSGDLAIVANPRTASR